MSDAVGCRYGNVMMSDALGCRYASVMGTPMHSMTKQVPLLPSWHCYNPLQSGASQPRSRLGLLGWHVDWGQKGARELPPA